jgi:amidohydrolase
VNLKQNIHNLATEAHEALIGIRRHLHAHPELSFHEKETSAYVAKVLRSWDIPCTEGVGGYGVVGLIGKSGTGNVVALRGDMDALPIREENEVDYASRNPGVMHACGHDVHTTCLLGAAKVLKAIEHKLPGQVKLIFQPAEERIPGGASLMIKDGVLNDPHVELIFGQHVYPEMEVGHVGFRGGIYMASADELYITIHGKGGHAALPHKNIDPVLISAHLITAIQQLVSRRALPTVPAVVSIGRVIAEGATNIIPDKVVMEGTMRTMDEAVRAKLHDALETLVHQLAASMGGSATLEIRKGYPALVNDEELTAWSKSMAIELLGEAHVHDLEMRMTAEDFAYFAQVRPACFLRLGVNNASKGLGAPLHTSKFNIDEDALITGSALMAYLAAQSLYKISESKKVVA